MATDNFCFYLQNRLIQTRKTGGQWYGDTSPFSIPCKFDILVYLIQMQVIQSSIMVYNPAMAVNHHL
jgi:hypothetical protein